MTQFVKLSDGWLMAAIEAQSGAGLPPGFVPADQLPARDTRPSAEHRLRLVNGQWEWADPRTLAQLKDAKRADIRRECVARAYALYEGVDSYGTLELFVGLWTQGLAGAAKNPQGDWLKLVQTVQAAKVALVAVRDAATAEQVAAVSPQWPA